MTARHLTENGILRITYLSSVFIILIFLFYSNTCIAQTRLYLQHQYKTARQKNISIKKEFNFQTSDTTFYRCRIISFTDSTLFIKSKYSEEAFEMFIVDITSIEKMKKFGFFDFTAMIGLIGLSITPVIWATEGNEAALEMLAGAGTFVGCSIPFILLRDIGRKKDLKNKWMLCLKQP